MPVIGYQDALNDALERMTDLGYERGAGADLANHGPMGAEALAVLGHGDEVAAWVEGYRTAMPHHEVPARSFPLDPADETSWRPALGDFSRAGDWEQLFARELADEAWRGVVARWWPRLLPGLLAGLTHGLIRTAHAVRSLAAAPVPTPHQLTELSRGLAYWAARFAHLPGQVRMRGGLDLAGAVAALPRTPFPGERDRAMTARRLARPDELAGWSEALDALAPGRAEWVLSEMTTEFAGVYLGHPEVFPIPLVHGVTAPAAARLVLPHLPVELHEPTVAALWQVHAAFLLAFTADRGGEAVAAREAAETELPSFGELAARAVEHGDEHVLKFTEACAREHALRPDPRFAAAALAAQRRIEPVDWA
ncbi:hypothetical protein AF335_23095 [Streptomyces eurocidicus]|uniref:DUF4243 domain-containing protein n=1 Tax=Streptomyces eurocidicus TaxID=66423 RepID=A0A2N8NSI9_STREU|nr:questin oxidase family protein [Streptomyces eurocidicus]MBB5119981.1 hypothetical protein [Streptomyces eurocidicus]MBF6051807.1 DUF4243 domain-containing protein [Streptomyces eurocidicus]PNE31730.1 hypothetical protein AF335_23095 [Streptomyces eurocidicus]